MTRFGAKILQDEWLRPYIQAFYDLFEEYLLEILEFKS